MDADSVKAPQSTPLHVAASPAVSLLSLPPYLLQRILLSLPGRPGRSAAGAVCACKDVHTAWRTDLGRPEVIAVHLRARYPGDPRRALSYVYGKKQLRSLLLPPGPTGAEERATALLNLAAELTPEQHRQAAQVVCVAASAAVGDAAVVRNVLARRPGCCSVSKLTRISVKAILAGQVAVADALLEGGAGADAAAAVAAARGWDPLETLQAGRADVVAVLLRHGLHVPAWQLMPLIEGACQTDAVGALQALLRVAQQCRAASLPCVAGQQLYAAAARGGTAVVEELLAARVLTEEHQSYVQRALCAAVESQHVDTIVVLLRAGASAQMACLDTIQDDEHIGRLQALLQAMLQAGCDVSRFGFYFWEDLVRRRQRLLLRALLLANPHRQGMVEKRRMGDGPLGRLGIPPRAAIAAPS